VIVEVQLRTDERKLLSWPVYVSTLRAKLACAAVLLVVAPDRDVATWARQPIELGHPGFRLTPVVIEFKDVPWVRDRAAASRLPELAMLSVMAHPELEIAEVAVGAISQLPEDRRQLYLDVILMALPAAIRRILEARMQGYEYQSDFARKYYGQGRKEGRQEGRKEGRQVGRKEGRQVGRKEGRHEGLRAAVVALARTKLGELSNDDLAAIEAVSAQRL
jgi:flagellar biosynthesis/type III secretory pathway protein FliH